MNYLSKIIGEIETHSVDGIKECFANGLDPNVLYNNEPLIYELTSEYLRSPRFKDCVKIFVDYGLVFEDKALLTVLLDDKASLNKIISENPEIVKQHYSLKCSFTPLKDVTLLHICAEYGHFSCAEVLVNHGADINAQAGIDENGFGGQTPIFHTVNQIHNHSAGMLHFLLSHSPEIKITLPGLIWGKGYDWETLIPAVNPISYAMMGLLPQMHRNEMVIAETVSLLIKYAFGIEYVPPNIPNKYLRG